MNRVIYSLIIIINIAFVFLFEHRATYAALYAVILLPVLSLVILLVTKNRVYVSEKLEDLTVKKGGSARYIIKLENNNYIFNLRAKIIFSKNTRRFIKISKTGVIFINSRSSAETAVNMQGCYRGVYNISAEKILIYDLLGLFRAKIKNTGDLKLTVLPDIHSLSDLPVLLNNNNFESLSMSGLSGGEYSDFKKYHPNESDGYKRIHWQLSAKRGELISKNYLDSEINTACIIINNVRLPESLNKFERMRREDILIEDTVSVISYCVSAGMPVYLNYIGGSSGKATLDFDYLYMLAAGIVFDGDEDFNIDTGEINGSNIYIFTHEVTEALSDFVNGKEGYRIWQGMGN